MVVGHGSRSTRSLNEWTGVEQDHWNERGRALSNTNAYALGCPSCSVYSLDLMDGISLITIVVVIFAITAARHHSSRDRIVRHANQARRAARSGERATKASVRMSNAAIAFSSAASRASNRAQQAQNCVSWWCWCFFSKLLIWCSRWFMGRSARLRDRAKAKLQSCDTILASLGVKPDA